MPPNISIKNTKRDAKSIHYSKICAVVQFASCSGGGMDVIVRDIPPNSIVEVCLVGGCGLAICEQRMMVELFPLEMKSNSEGCFHFGIANMKGSPMQMHKFCAIKVSWIKGASYEAIVSPPFVVVDKVPNFSSKEFHIDSYTTYKELCSKHMLTSVIYTKDELCQPQCLTQFIVASGSEQHLHTYLKEPRELALGVDGLPIAPPDRVYTGKELPVKPRSFSLVSPDASVSTSSSASSFCAISAEVFPMRSPLVFGPATFSPQNKRSLKSSHHDEAPLGAPSLSSAMIHSSSFCVSSFAPPLTPVKSLVSFPCSSSTSSFSSSSSGGSGSNLVTPHLSSTAMTLSDLTSPSTPLARNVSNTQHSSHQRAFMSPINTIFSPIRHRSSTPQVSSTAGLMHAPFSSPRSATKRGFEASSSSSSCSNIDHDHMTAIGGQLLWDTLVEHLPFVACDDDLEIDHETDHMRESEQGGRFDTNMMSPVPWKTASHNSVDSSSGRARVSFNNNNNSSLDTITLHQSTPSLLFPPPTTSSFCGTRSYRSEPPSFFDAKEARHAAQKCNSTPRKSANVSGHSKLNRKDKMSTHRARASSSFQLEVDSEGEGHEDDKDDIDSGEEEDSIGEVNMELDFLLTADDGDAWPRGGTATSDESGVSVSMSRFSGRGGRDGMTSRAVCVSACTVPTTPVDEEETEARLSCAFDAPTPRSVPSAVKSSGGGPFGDIRSAVGRSLGFGTATATGGIRATALFACDAASPFKKRKQKR